MTPENAIALAVALPLAGAVLIVLCDRRPNLRETVTLATAVLLFATVASLVPTVSAGGRPDLVLVELFPGLPLRLTVEPLGMLFALIASGLWIVTSIYSIGYMRANNEHKQTRFYACFAIALAATMGVAFAGNMLTLFVFYEALTLSTYPLVIHHETPEALRAGRTYLGILIGTSIGLLLLGMIATWSIAGTLDFQQGGILTGKTSDAVVGLLLLLYVFGIGKAALMPIHRWLPAAMVAPTPVSALLHAVAVVKAGVFAVVKVMVYIFGIDLLSGLTARTWLIYIAGATILIASIIALRQDNLKLRLAYSTISQLSYVILGAALANGWGVIGGSMHIAMHALGKITLFFCAGAIYTAAHKTKVSELDGIGRVMPFTMFAFFLGSLSVIGLPPFGGSWSKWYLALGAADAGYIVIVAVLMISSLLNVAYLLPVVGRAFFLPPSEAEAATAPAHAGSVCAAAGGQPERLGGLREAPIFCVVALMTTAVGSLVVFFFADRIYDLLSPLVLR